MWNCTPYSVLARGRGGKGATNIDVWVMVPVRCKKDVSCDIYVIVRNWGGAEGGGVDEGWRPGGFRQASVSDNAY